MDATSAERLLDVLIENAARILNAQFGVNHAEPTFFQIIDLVRTHPFLKAAILARIATSLRQREVGVFATCLPTRELIELVSHEFRWPELRDLSEERVETFFHGDRSLAAGDVARGMIEAQTDDWEDREFYARYRTQ